MTMPFLTPLSDDQQRAAGLERPQPLAIADRVRFAELDPLDHVNNVAYMTWFETLRTRYIDAWGLVGPSVPDAPRVVIRSGQIHYRQEMHRNQVYVATCGCTAFRTTSFTLLQQVWSGATLHATLECVMVLLAHDGSGRYPIPAATCARFGAIDKAIAEI